MSRCSLCCLNITLSTCIINGGIRVRGMNHNRYSHSFWGGGVICSQDSLLTHLGDQSSCFTFQMAWVLAIQNSLELIGYLCPHSFLLFLTSFQIFKIRFLCIALAVSELSLYSRLVSDGQNYTCLCLLCVQNKVVHCHQLTAHILSRCVTLKL